MGVTGLVLFDKRTTEALSSPQHDSSKALEMPQQRAAARHLTVRFADYVHVVSLGEADKPQQLAKQVSLPDFETLRASLQKDLGTTATATNTATEPLDAAQRRFDAACHAKKELQHKKEQARQPTITEAFAAAREVSAPAPAAAQTREQATEAALESPAALDDVAVAPESAATAAPSEEAPAAKKTSTKKKKKRAAPPTTVPLMFARSENFHRRQLKNWTQGLRDETPRATPRATPRSPTASAAKKSAKSKKDKPTARPLSPVKASSAIARDAERERNAERLRAAPHLVIESSESYEPPAQLPVCLRRAG